MLFFCAYCLHVYVHAACSNYNTGYESRQTCAFMLHNCRFSEQVLNLHLGFWWGEQLWYEYTLLYASLSSVLYFEAYFTEHWFHFFCALYTVYLIHHTHKFPLPQVILPLLILKFWLTTVHSQFKVQFE